MSATWIVLPTYNEAENIARLVEAVLPELASTGEHRILVVDDDSPDGTGRIADDLAARHEAVEVLHRAGKEGLGRAYVAGFERALAGGAELIMEMDADFSHDPADIPRLVHEARNGADLVLGSRYARGGGIENWGVGRRIVSRGGCLYAQAILRVPVRDLTGGFKCFRRRVIEGIGIQQMHADGYGFQIELTYRALKAGFHVRELPIVFRERRAGASKMSARIAVEAVWKVPALKLRLP
ncbi:MAG: dolichol-phosphate mannosyltransferase [Thermoleophilaceae bacterium]|jgi:dolichol-phosphate mannosyltransferase|nr:dolichol-phosphate mannosyltransferase [Thermoleophilaceae bacterium]